MAYFLLGVGFLATLTAVFRDHFGKLKQQFLYAAIVLAVCALGASIKLERDAQRSALNDQIRIDELVSELKRVRADIASESAEQQVERDRQDVARQEDASLRKLDKCEKIYADVQTFHSAVESVRNRRNFVTTGYAWNNVLSDQYHQWKEHDSREDTALSAVFRNSILKIMSPELYEYYNRVQPTGIQSALNHTNAIVKHIDEQGCGLEWKGHILGFEVVVKE